MPRTRLQQISLAALLLLAAFLCFLIVRPFLYAIVAAIAVAICAVLVSTTVTTLSVSAVM